MAGGLEEDLAESDRHFRWPSLRRPAIIAHRGFSARAPENTLAAVELALAAGADMVEIDVGFSADLQPVVIHDDTLERTTTGRGPVRAASLAELRALDAGAWFGPRFADERIPRLEEVLDLVRGRLPINVEIKSDSVEPAEGPAGMAGSADGIEARTLALVRERGMLDQVVFSSFHPLALWRLGRREPAAHLASLLHRPWHGGRGPREIAGEVGAEALHVADAEATPELVGACRAAGIPLRVYTVNSPERFRELAAAGIDAVFTDDPALLLAHREVAAKGAV